MTLQAARDSSNVVGRELLGGLVSMAALDDHCAVTTSGLLTFSTLASLGPLDIQQTAQATRPATTRTSQLSQVLTSTLLSLNWASSVDSSSAWPELSNWW